jgi:hypothetical protein
MHAFNLSHPNLSVFLNGNDLLNKIVGGLSFIKSFLLIIGLMILSPLIALGLLLYALLTFQKLKHCIKKIIYFIFGIKSIRESVNQIFRTLSFYEIPLEYQFLILDYFLRTKEPKFNHESDQLVIGGKPYDKIVLCPLVIDFGRKNIPDGFFYDKTPKSPIANQVGDLLYAIRTYYRFSVDVTDGKMKLSDEIKLDEGKRTKLFEIYPFMGLDTQNHDTWEDIKSLLDKYFLDFEKDEPAETRREKLFNKMGELDSNMYNKTEGHYFNIFAGIKVYPQLGFNPYPDDLNQRIKVEKLYEYCINKRIPIISHCSDGGYKPEDNDELTSPLGKWKKVLEQPEFQNLTLCFAHFGSQKSQKTQWRDAIIDLTKTYPNVYTDISCNDMTPEYYSALGKLFNDKNPQLHERVLFGSDFSINMLATEVQSYNQYLKAFSDAKLEPQTDLCERNPERFLFGGVINHN